MSAVRPGETVRAAVRAAIAPGWHINSATPLNPAYIAAELAFDTVGPLTPHGIVYPVGHETPLLGEVMSVYEGSIFVRFDISVAASAAPGAYRLPVRFTSQACNDKSCMPPSTVDADIDIVVGDNGQPLYLDIFGAATSDTAGSAPATRPTASAESLSDIDRLVAEYGFWGYLLALGLAFVTGLLLSFSPCTYPMIPITVSIFAGQERSVGRGFVMSLFYVGSMAVVYGVMGLIVSLVGGVFGAWLASPPVVIGIAVVFVVFSLSMFGLYELQVPMAIRNKLGTARGGGVMGAIILGVVAALVVSPCVGPFVAGILLYVATSGSPLIGFLVLFVFALGLGTLFVIIGTFSSAITALPRSGEWMEQVKKFFGFVLLLMALYFLRTIIAADTLAILTALLLLAFGVFGGGLDRLTPETGFFARLKKLLGVIALLLGAYLLIGSILLHGFILPPSSEWLPVARDAGVRTAHSPIAWETDLETGLARAAAEAKPIVIDTWATWCVNCKVLEQKTFNHPDVVRALAQVVPIKLQLETADAPATRAFKARFGIKQYSLPPCFSLMSGVKLSKSFRESLVPMRCWRSWDACSSRRRISSGLFFGPGFFLLRQLDGPFATAYIFAQHVN